LTGGNNDSAWRAVAYRGNSGTPRTVFWAAISNNLVAIARAA
jgi:hypothetical protein